MTRADILAEVRKQVREKFPKATITTNDDANPATPITIKATWSNGRLWKVVRANTLTATAEEISVNAIAVLEKYQAANVRDSEQAA